MVTKNISRNGDFVRSIEQILGFELCSIHLYTPICLIKVINKKF